jgi:hypothetical protein
MSQEQKDVIKGLILSNVDQESLDNFVGEMVSLKNESKPIEVDFFATALVNLIFDPLKK